jgi:hypothetical protein
MSAARLAKAYSSIGPLPVLGIAVFVIAAGIGVWAARPFNVATIGSDSAATVLYFDRIISGERLELFLGTAPKPLLSFIYGPLYYAFDDWRPIAWAAIVAYALGIAAASVLAGRVAHSPAAAAFTATGLLASTWLLRDVSLAYSVSWALLGWSLAGLAATGSPPRYALAGIALMLAGLVRPETWFITLLAGLWISLAWLWSRRGTTPPPPRRAWMVLIGLLAIPIGAAHDWLLTGDLLYSFATPTLGTAIRTAQDAGRAAFFISGHVGSSLPLVVLALVGLAVLVARQSWPVVIGLLALGPGVAAFLLYLGWRGTFVLNRYALPIDLALVVGAGIGFAALAIPLLAPIVRSLTPASARGAMHAGAGVAVAVALVPALGPVDRPTIREIRSDRHIVENFQAAAPVIESELDGIPGVRDMPPERDAHDVAPHTPALLVPARVYPTAAVQFDLPLTQVERLQGMRLAGDGSYPSTGQIVVHDELADRPPDQLDFLEVDEPTVHESIGLVPVLADPQRGIWVVRIEEPS